MAEKIKKWYNQGLWTAIMVKNAAKKGVIAPNWADDIIGVTEVV